MSIVSFIVAISVCFAAILVLRPAAINWGLVDSPDNRKQHNGNIPLIGGLAIYIATLTSVTLFVENSQNINLLLISMSLMVFIGALDDKYDLNAKLRLVAQVLIACVLTYGTDIHLYELGNLLGLGDVSTGLFSSLVTILAILAGINAFNMTDGIDGLAGSLGLISLLALSFIVYAEDYWLLMGILSLSVVVFLFFNLDVFSNKMKIFMGDAGSMLLGLVISWMLIITSQDTNIDTEPAHFLWFIAVPLIDMVSVMLRRARKGKSPLVADREHLHHVFMEIGFDSKKALLFISTIAMIFSVIGVGFIKYSISGSVSFLSIVVIFIIYNYLLNNRDKIKKLLLK